jgi:nitrogen fixation NifU-like protein
MPTGGRPERETASMVEDLYQRALLRHAANAHGTGRLAEPDGSAVVDNPLCGDRVTMDVRLGCGQVTALGHEVRACVLCQASASILAETAAGETMASLHALEDAVRAMLREQAPMPAGKWAEYRIFESVAPYRNRHSCVLLPIEAAWRAIEDATS